jgi:iron complex outermembrane recepter protein
MKLFTPIQALIAVTALCAVSAAYAQPGTEEDSLRTYRLGEVTVIGDTIARVSTTTVQQIPYARIARTDAQTAAGIVYQIPGARIQTNSRGEALVYMRAAAERQVALFFDGAMMNVPWDNRLDMSLLPMGAVGGMTVSKGVPSVLYGANTLGGTINMVSLDQREPGYSTEFQSQAGTNGLLGGSLVHMGRSGSISYIGELGYSSRDGVALPEGTDLPFHQSSTDVRTNSDLRTFNAYLRGENSFSENAEVGLALYYVDSEKGVAPEGHVEGARFWRYPKWQGLTVSLNSEVDFGADKEWSFRGAAWGNSFAQDIAQYEDATYTLKSAQEEDRDFTLGTRLLLRRALGESGGVTLAFNGFNSTHDQRDLAYDSTGALADANVPTASYEQRTYSVGLEAEQRFGAATVTLGGSFDGMTTPKTGDKPSQEPFSDYGVVAGVAYQIDPSMVVRASGGRKTRFPTMRELYGEALRRFLINPNLKPEQTWVGEVGLENRGTWGSVGVNGFSYFTTNTIDQRNFDTLGGAKRQRINLPGSRAFGAELTASLRAFEGFRLDGHLMYVHARGHRTGSDGADTSFLLSEKPDMISTITAEYVFDFGLMPSFELLYTGLAYSPNDDNEMVALEHAPVFNFRLGYRFSPWGTALAQVYARVNNITNALVEPQLGLPGAGREIVGGVKLSL